MILEDYDMISKTGIHALRALSTLTKLPAGEYAGAGDIADEIGAPRNYLGKLLKTLADEGLLVSQKGKGGGFRLAREASQISLYEVMDPIEHVGRWTNCLLGHGECSTQSPCTLHNRWGKVRDAYLRFLRETTVADVNMQGASAVCNVK
jgi:Rrf2 family transcriptional regulator, iron-sulfur cluster assembly transcription factor